MSNRLFVLLCFLLLSGVATPAGAAARAQTPSPPAAAPALPTVIPVCALDGEIGAGRGRITARGATRGYRGELTWTVSTAPEVVIGIDSDFAPHQPAVDHITLTIGTLATGTADSVPEGGRLSGAFGELAGRRFTIVRGAQDTADRRWFDELASGAALTATDGEVSAPVTWPAAQMEQDYNYLLDLLQLVAGWEIAGLCVNRAAD